jgi:hypothetical protein
LQKNLQTQRSRQQADSPFGELKETTKDTKKDYNDHYFLSLCALRPLCGLVLSIFFCGFAALGLYN